MDLRFGWGLDGDGEEVVGDGEVEEGFGVVSAPTHAWPSLPFNQISNPVAGNL